MAVVQEAVEDGSGKHLLPEDGAPLRDGLIRGDERAAPLVAPRDELEEEVRAALLEWQVPELIHDKEFRLGEEGQLVVELPVALGGLGRSWERDTTKGGHADAIPIPADLVPWLRAALDASECLLVFPGSGGQMFRRDVPLESVLRRALGRTGIVRHWRHVCRRRGCKHVEERQDQAVRRCPTCGMKLWPKPVVRPVRFHDLRHTTATLLLRSGVPLVVVQKMLRHRDPKLTEATYGHLATDFLRAEVNRLKFEGMPLPKSPRARAVAGGRFPPVSPTFRKTPKGPEQPRDFLSDSDPFSVSGRQDSNLRPLGPEGEPGFSTGSTSVQAVGFLQSPAHSCDATTRAGRSGTLGRVPPVSPNPQRGLQVRPADASRLLTVREVAACLRTSTATVYALCGRGDLPHARVSNAIRIRPEDLEAYLLRK